MVNPGVGMKAMLESIKEKKKNKEESQEFIDIDLPLFIYDTVCSNYGYVPIKDFYEMKMPILIGIVSTSMERNYKQLKELEKTKSNIKLPGGR